MQKPYVLFSSVLFHTALIVLIHLSMVLETDAQQRYEFESGQMGTTFQIILYADCDSAAQSAATEAFRRIEYLNSVLSDYIEDSELSRLSDVAGAEKEIPISKPLYDLIEKSIEISKASNGWFDITIGPYSHIWRGLNRMRNPELPDSAEMAKAQSKVGYELITLNPTNHSVRLHKEEMRLDPGGIGKGYAADEALRILRKSGINMALIDAGGDVSAGDPPPGNDGWTVAIPVRINQDSTYFKEILLANQSVNTSGSLYQSVEIAGKTYSHIINPKSGLGHTKQVQVSVISDDGATADAFATALNVMPIEKARELVKTTSNLEVAIYTLNERGSVDRWASKGFDRFLKR